MSLSYKDWKKITKGLGENNLLNNLLAHWELIFRNVFVWDTSETGKEDLGVFIERTLYNLGSVAFFKMEDTGVYGALPYTAVGGLNMYGLFDKWKVIGANGYNKNFNIDNSVIIKNNDLMMSNFSYVYSQVIRLVNIEETIDVNINQLKVPMVFSGNEDSLLTMKNVYRKITNNEPVIYVDKKIEMGSELKGIGTGANYHGAELMQLYNDIEGRLLKVAGLKYVHTEKKERLIVDEVNSNDGLSNTFLYSALKQRQLACEKIKEVFGINISVDINPLLKLSDPDKDSNNEEDGEDNGLQ